VPAEAARCPHHVRVRLGRRAFAPVVIEVA
jgi:hypothetical protein